MSTATAASVGTAKPAAVGPKRQLRGRGARVVLWALPPIVVVAGFVLYPLIEVVRQSFVDDNGHSAGISVWKSVYRSEQFRRAIVRTIELSAGATAGCIVIGTFLAIVLVFVPFPGAHSISRLVDIVLAFPSFLIALSFTFLYGSTGMLNSLLMRLTGAKTPPVNFIYSPWGVLLAEITFYTPFVMRPLVAAFSRIPREQLDVAASLGARPGRVIRQILLPEAMPAIAAGGSLTLLMTLNEFGIVLFIGAKNVVTMPLLVYTKSIVTFQYSEAAVVATTEVVLSLALYAAYRFAFSRAGGNRARVV